MLRNYLIIAWRNLLRNKQTSLINLLGMALGITCCLVIFQFVRYESSFDSFHAQARRTYRVVEQMTYAEGVEYRNTTAYPLAEALRNDFYLPRGWPRNTFQKLSPLKSRSLVRP